MRRRVLGWWSFAEAVLLRLTTPAVDVPASDRRVEQLLAESWLFRRGGQVSATIARAWLTSRLRVNVQMIAQTWPRDGRGRARRVGVVVVVAAITIAVLELLARGGA